jgi:SNF2 family DNA or RNA helicase
MIDTEKLDWSRCYRKPFEHQIVGVKKLLTEKYVGILDEMGAGKTKQIIDAACFLYEAKEIDAVLIICPAQVKDVWAHETYSQIVEHSFVSGIIHEFTSKSKSFPPKSEGLLWVVTSVELLRNGAHVQKLLQMLKGYRFWAAVDESSTISNHRASQTRGVMVIAPKAERRTIMNGTPVGQSPLDLYSQFQFLSPKILGFKNYFAFRNHHARMGGWMNKQIIAFDNIEEIQRKIKPYVLRRLKSECLDILPKMRAPLIEVRLSKESWKIYESMREEFVAYINGYDEMSIVSSAPVKSLRLAQICSGFLGGVQDEGDESNDPKTIEVGRELTNAFLERLDFRIKTVPKLKLIVWCRFRPEINRLARLCRERFPNLIVQTLQGGLSKAQKDEAKSLFHPDAPDPEREALLIGQPQAGRFGSNFTKCHLVDRISTDYSHITYVQSEDRVHRPGQKEQTLFQDYVVVGPNRERTISGIILKALRTHEDLAKWTCSQWEKEIMQEDSDDIPF